MSDAISYTNSGMSGVIANKQSSTPPMVTQLARRFRAQKLSSGEASITYAQNPAMLRLDSMLDEWEHDIQILVNTEVYEPPEIFNFPSIDRRKIKVNLIDKGVSTLKYISSDDDI